LFETREAQPPTVGSANFVPPTSPDLVIANLEHAVTEKNTENYIRCLVDTLNSTQRFQFIPTAGAAGRYASTFSSWSLQSERSYFSALKAFSGTAPSSLQLDGSFSIITGDSAIYEGRYDIVFRHGLGGVDENAHGSVQFILHMDRSSIWSITRWIDIPATDRTSWSEWKGRFAN